MKKGNAYVLVIVASLLVLTLVLTVLTVTAVSRQITARYGYFYGMYDLAVAGNAQVFYLIKQEYPHREFDGYRREWELTLEFSDLPQGGVIRDEFRAETNVRSKVGGGFYIETFVRKGECPCLFVCECHGVLVRSTVEITKILDVYTFAMVELLRVAD
jgi:hypothetical protein